MFISLKGRGRHLVVANELYFMCMKSFDHVSISWTPGE